MLRLLGILLVCGAAGACSTYQPTPIWGAVSGVDLESVAVAACGPTATTTPHGEMSCVRARIAARVETYSTRAAAMSDEGIALDGAAFASTIASLGMIAFDAHPDNIVATSLGSGILNIVSAQTDWRGRYAIYQDGAQALACIYDETTLFASASAGDDRDAFAAAHTALTRGLGTARARARGLDADEEGQARLDAAMARVESMATEAAHQHHAIESAARQTMRAARLADRSLLARERSAMPNVAEIVRMTRELETRRTDPPAPPVAEDADEGERVAEGPSKAFLDAENRTQLATALHALANEFTLPLTNYHGALTGLTTCVALASTS